MEVVIIENITMFKNEIFGEIRTIIEDEKVLFVASDIAKSLGYTNTSKAVLDHCKGVTKRSTLTKGGNQELNYIYEGDVYRLIVRSKLDSAEKFELWLFDEVLPTIRKTGGYVNNEDLFMTTYLPYADESTKLMFKTTLEVVRQQNDKIKQLELEKEINQPLVEFANQISNTKDTIDMNQMAKILKDEKIDIGRNRLFDFLKKKKILMKDNQPYQKYLDSGWFKVIETSKDTCYGVKLFTKTLVLGKGQLNVVELVRKEYSVI